MKRSVLLIAVAVSMALRVLHAEDAPPIPKADYARLAVEMEAHLNTHIVNPWFPLAVDKERGGFIQDYAEDWTEKRDGNKTLVYQSRLFATLQLLTQPEAELLTLRGVLALEWGLTAAARDHFETALRLAGPKVNFQDRPIAERYVELLREPRRQ